MEIQIDSDSDSSIIEVAKPPRPAPTVISIEDNEEEFLFNFTIPEPNKINLNLKEEVAFQMSPHDGPSIDPMSSCLSPYHWTSDMKKYYNADWGNENNFIVTKLQRGMAKFPKLWAISDKDKFSTFSKRGIQCRTCLNYGHKASRCTKVKEKICAMCGENGHLKKLCPKRCCLTCGKSLRSFIPACSSCLSLKSKQCSRCSGYGHSILDCSDHWRKFHATISSEEITTPSPGSEKKPSALLWCCNCGRKGHEAFSCQLNGKREFPLFSPFVCSYDNSFNIEARSKSAPPRQWKRYFEDHSPLETLKKSKKQSGSTDREVIARSLLSSGSPDDEMDDLERVVQSRWRGDVESPIRKKKPRWRNGHFKNTPVRWRPDEQSNNFRSKGGNKRKRGQEQNFNGKRDQQDSKRPRWKTAKMRRSFMNDTSYTV